jgi:hypothetical protein
MLNVEIRMTSQDSVQMPPLTTTDVREWLEGWGFRVGNVRFLITPDGS